MAKHKEITCSKCGQKLRVPGNVGGIVMACPSCGKRIHSDFKVGGVNKKKSVKQSPKQPGVFIQLFELPGRLLDMFSSCFRR